MNQDQAVQNTGSHDVCFWEKVEQRQLGEGGRGAGAEQESRARRWCRHISPNILLGWSGHLWDRYLGIYIYVRLYIYSKPLYILYYLFILFWFFKPNSAPRPILIAMTIYRRPSLDLHRTRTPRLINYSVAYMVLRTRTSSAPYEARFLSAVSSDLSLWILEKQVMELAYPLHLDW